MRHFIEMPLILILTINKLFNLGVSNEELVPQQMVDVDAEPLNHCKLNFHCSRKCQL